MGGTYNTKTEGDWTCIAENGDTVWMVRNYGSGAVGTAYTWTKGGKAICLSIRDEYDVDLGPVIEEEYMSIVNADNITLGKATVTTTNGKPDWSTLKVGG